LPPVVANCESLGSLGSLGRYGALSVIRSNLFFIFENRFVFIALNPFFFRSFTAAGFMSAVSMFSFGRNFDTVTERVPEPVPMSK